MEERFRVGVISSTHGIHGEVKVFPTTDDVKRFAKHMELFFAPESEEPELIVERVKFFKQFAILKFVGIDDINDVEQYKGKSLYVARDKALPLKEGEYYVADLIGLQVCEDNGGALGRLKEVLHTGANDVYEVALAEGGSLLLPAIRECILDIDLEAGRMLVHVMEGLR